MRVLFSTLLIVSLLFAMFMFMPTDIVSASKISDATVYIYCKTFDGEFIENGNGKIVIADSNTYKDILKSASGIDGISFSFVGGQSDIDDLQNTLKLKIVYTETVDDIVCIYGYSSLVKGSVNLDGKKINVQIAKSNDTISVGSPLILGSY